MEKILKFILILSCFIFFSCKEETAQLPERVKSEEVAVIANRYIDILKSSNQGWLLTYKAESYTDSVIVNLIFNSDTELRTIAAFRNYHSDYVTSTYDFEGSYTPIIIFDGETVFKELSTNYNGFHKFKIVYKEEEDIFELKRSDGYDNKVFILKRVGQQADLSDLNAKIDSISDRIVWEIEQLRLTEEARLKFKAFAEIESDFYFYNFVTNHFSARINSVDTVTKSLSLTYKMTPTSAPSTSVVNYSFYPDGIVLSPTIQIGSYRLDSIALGDRSATQLEILSAGNSGHGYMGYAHVAPYEFTLSTDRSVSTASWFMAPEQVREDQNGYLYYTNHSEGYYSPLVNDLRTIFGPYLEENLSGVVVTSRFVHQLYRSSTRTNIQISTGYKSPATANRFFLYNVNYSLSADAVKRVIITLTTTNTDVTPHKAAFDAYLEPQFPPGGVTIVPVVHNGERQLRLVSSADSRYWVNYRFVLVEGRNLIFD